MFHHFYFSECKAAVYKIRKPTDGRMLVCCRFKRIKFECNPGYKLVDGDQFLRCRKGKILGKFPKCACMYYYPSKVHVQNTTCGVFATLREHSSVPVIDHTQYQFPVNHMWPSIYKTLVSIIYSSHYPSFLLSFFWPSFSFLQ